jgi:peroxin-4
LVRVQVQKEADDTVVLEPSDDNIFMWSAFIKGPEGSPYEGGIFHVPITVPEEYPHAAPKANFMTKIFHANVHPSTGEICLDVLKEAWSPAWTLLALCRAIVALLSNPEQHADSPLNCDAGNLLRANDMRGYNSACRLYVTEYANHSIDDLRRRAARRRSSAR